MGKPLSTEDEFTLCRKEPRGAHRSMHCCVFPHLLQTPFSPFSEICQCHLCEHEGHLVESCLLPAECTALASAPRLVILAPENQHMLLFSEHRQGGAEQYRFLSCCCQQGRAAPLWPLHSLCRAWHLQPLCRSPDLCHILSSLSQHQEAWNSPYHNLQKVLSENIVHLTCSELPGITAR